MSEEFVVSQCSPTMAGLKTGSLFTCAVENEENFNKIIRQYNSRLVPRGLRLLPFKCKGGRALVYMYRPSRLVCDLSDELAIQILSKREYPVNDPHRCLLELKKRINDASEFPHEVGLFLGYPSEDVDGFIENKAQFAKAVGTWKVYGDEEAAQKRFDAYRKCTNIYKETYKTKNCFDKLLVAG